MDFFNLLTLVSLALSSYGVANVYNGKKDKDAGTLGRGVISLAVGFLAICWLNPVFPRSLFFSLVIALLVTIVLLGYMAETFSKVDEKTVINVEILGRDDKEKPKKQDDIVLEGEPVEKPEALPSGNHIENSLRDIPKKGLRELVKLINRKAN